MMFFGGIGSLGFIVFLLAIISLIKQTGNEKNFIIFSICFIVLTAGDASVFTIQKQEKKKVNKTLDKIETINKTIKTGISYSLFVKAKNTLNVKVLQSILADYQSIGNIIEGEDGFFVVVTDGKTVLETKEFKTLSEVYTYERELGTNAKAEKRAREEMETKAAAEIIAQERTQMKANAKTIDYSHLEKDPDFYKGINVKYTGQIVQILEGNGTTNIRLAVTKKSYGYSLRDIIFVKYNETTDFSENEMITVYGVITGDYSYVLHANYNHHLPGLLANEITKPKI